MNWKFVLAIALPFAVLAVQWQLRLLPTLLAVG